MYNIKKVQTIQLNMAREVKRICEMHDIAYWLDGGSLLGAVRHGGFIPWDDDLDIGMLRADYEKFLLVAKEELNEEFALKEWQITPEDHYYPHAKIRKKGTIFMESRSNPKVDNGIWIDIFSYDVYPKKRWKQMLMETELMCIKKIVALKKGDQPWKDGGIIIWKSFFANFPFLLMSPLYSESLKKLYYKIATRYNSEKDFEYYTVNYIGKTKKYILPRKCLENLKPMKFEGEEFLCSAYYDQNLRKLYGDYMKFPPKEEREKGHNVVKVDYGEEKN